MITVVNIIIREISIFLIKKIGYHLESEEVTDVMRIIFIATFLNTAILLLLYFGSLTDFREVKLSFSRVAQLTGLSK